nr:uncharacterized protein LOC127329684 [Lolium perenne]
MKVHGERKQSQWSNFFDCWQKKQQPLSPTPSLSLSHSIPHSPPRFHQPPGAARASSDVAGVGDHGQVPDELRDGASRASSSRGCEGELGHGTEQASQLGAARERSSRDGTGEVRHSRRGRPRRDAGADELRDGAARASSSRGGEGELGHGAAGQPLARGGRGRAQHLLLASCRCSARHQQSHDQHGLNRLQQKPFFLGHLEKKKERQGFSFSLSFGMIEGLVYP